MDWLALAESWTRARPGAPVPLSPSHERRPPLQGPAPLTHSELECWSIRVRVHRDRDSVSACDSDALGLVDCRAAHSGTGLGLKCGFNAQETNAASGRQDAPL